MARGKKKIAHKPTESIRLGERVTVTSEILGDGGCKPEKTPLRVSGYVVYVHPERRFFTAEFTFGGIGGTNQIRESFGMGAVG